MNGRIPEEVDPERAWSLFVDLAVVLWLGLFVADTAYTFGAVALAAGTAEAVDLALTVLLAVFLVDLALLYRWSEQGPIAFSRSNWWLILTVVPWFRPFRLLRAGRGLRVLRALVRSRRAGSLLTKLRRLGGRLRRRIGGD